MLGAGTYIIQELTPALLQNRVVAEHEFLAENEKEAMERTSKMIHENPEKILRLVWRITEFQHL